MSKRRPIIRPKDLNRLDLGTIAVDGDKHVAASARACSLCQHKETPRTRTLRASVASWLQNPKTPICEKCEAWLADPVRGMREGGGRFA